MPKLIWGASGTRYFENGVDKAVLYPPGEYAVPWSGLVGVNEAPTGAEEKAYYQDGIKYGLEIAPEEYAATIQAISIPEAFSKLEGEAVAATGLIFTSQRRKTFDLCYRTRVGDDLNDKDYKIHLVYNAIAKPSQRNYATRNQTPTPTIFSWGISALPPITDGFSPTAHLIVDSRTANPVVLGYLEAILYGNDSKFARMPSQDELVSLFQWNPEALTDSVYLKGTLASTSDSVTNLYTNPRFVDTLNLVEVRRNLARDPALKTTPTAAGASASSHELRTGSGLVGGPDTYVRSTATQDRTVGGDIVTYGRNGWTTEGIGASINVEPNTVYTASFWARISKDYLARISAQSISGTGAGTPPTPATGPTVQLIANQWHRFSLTFTTPSSGMPAVRIDLDTVLTMDFQIGDTVDVAGYLIEKSDKLSDYFDGGVSPDPDLSPSWTGTADDSDSILRGQAVDKLSFVNVLGIASSKFGGSLRLIPNVNTVNGYAEVFPKFPPATPKSMTALATLNLEEPLDTPLGPNALAIRTLLPDNYILGNNNTETQQIRWKFDWSTNTGSGRLLLFHGGLIGSGEVYWSKLLLVEGDYDGPYFDGDTNPFIYKGQVVYPSWASGANESASYFQFYSELPETAPEGTAYIISGNIFVFNNGAWESAGPIPAVQ